MVTFEVTVLSTRRDDAEGRPLRLLVEADNWVAAWREGLRFLGRAGLPEDALCQTDEAGVRVEVPSDGRRFHVRCLADPHGPRPQAGAPIIVPPEAGQPGAARNTPDPVARVLSDLERQRLLSRPVRISSKTGLPTSPRPPRRSATPHAVPRPVSARAASAEARERPASRTQAFQAAPEELLPQQFRPVQGESGPPETFDLALRWAVDTAWDHVPCALALVVGCEAGTRGEVLAARGAREREARGCTIACDTGPAQLSRAPSLTRFSTARPLRFAPTDARTWELPVTSVLTAPVTADDGELTALGLVLVNATRASGFTDSELRAVTYLARTLASRM